jgi:hypothetical protein
MDGFEFEYDGGVETGVDAAEDLVHEIDFPDFVQQLLGDTGTEYDLIGADPDEDGLWNHLMLDSDVNPYVAN